MSLPFKRTAFYGLVIVAALITLTACTEQLTLRPDVAIDERVATAVPASATAFRNPIRPTNYCDRPVAGNKCDSPDPWLTHHNGNYYLTFTRGSRIVVVRAETITGLATAAEAVAWNDSTAKRCCNMWAPELHLLDGPNGLRWYIYYTAGPGRCCSDQRMYVLESAGSDPLGPYTYRGRLYDPSADYYAIDATIHQHIDGSLYLLWSGDPTLDSGPQSVFIAPMSNPWTLAGPRVLISRPTQDWEEGLNEAPAVIARNGQTFVTYSVSGYLANYRLGMLTNRDGNLLDPNAWTKSTGPVFEGANTDNVYRAGHNGFFTSPDGDEHWIIYHAEAVEPAGSPRTTRIQRFTWNADGTPDFGTPVSLAEDLAAPSGDPVYAQQFEDAPLQSSSGKWHNIFVDDGMVGDRGVSYQASGAGDYVTYSINVPEARTYNVKVRVKTGGDRAAVQLNIAYGDGTLSNNHGSPLDLFTPQTDYKELEVGNVTFGLSGMHRFTFSVVDKDSNSSDYWLAFDEIILMPAE